MSQRAFCASKGLDRDKFRRTVDKYADVVADRVTADGGALKPILARAKYVSPPEPPPEPDKTYRHRFWLREPVGEKCRGRVWSGPVFLYQPQVKLDCAWLDAALDAADDAFFATIDHTRQRKALASHSLHE